MCLNRLPSQLSSFTCRVSKHQHYSKSPAALNHEVNLFTIVGLTCSSEDVAGHADAATTCPHVLKHVLTVADGRSRLLPSPLICPGLQTGRSFTVINALVAMAGDEVKP